MYYIYILNDTITFYKIQTFIFICNKNDEIKFPLTIKNTNCRRDDCFRHENLFEIKKNDMKTILHNPTSTARLLIPSKFSK